MWEGGGEERDVGGDFEDVEVGREILLRRVSQESVLTCMFGKAT